LPDVNVHDVPPHSLSLGWLVSQQRLLSVQGRRLVQAQAQQQAEITFTESLEVVSLLRWRSCAAIAADITSLRHLFYW